MVFGAKGISGVEAFKAVQLRAVLWRRGVLDQTCISLQFQEQYGSSISEFKYTQDFRSSYFQRLTLILKPQLYKADKLSLDFV